jgi:hypothetical protein
MIVNIVVVGRNDAWMKFAATGHHSTLQQRKLSWRLAATPHQQLRPSQLPKQYGTQYQYAISSLFANSIDVRCNFGSSSALPFWPRIAASVRLFRGESLAPLGWLCLAIWLGPS